jgi:predicted transcriptional regulator
MSILTLKLRATLGGNTAMMSNLELWLARIEQTQAVILGRLDELVSLKTAKDFYSVEEVAERVGRTSYQVREWLRMGRMKGIKRPVGRGRHKEWMVEHAELERYLNHGLRPFSRAAG